MNKKKILSILMSLAMTTGLSTNVFADNTTNTVTYVELVSSLQNINAVNATQGKSASFNINVSASSIDQTTSVTMSSDYHISKTGVTSSSPVKVTLNKNTPTASIPATVTVDSDVNVGSIVVPISTVVTNNSNGNNQIIVQDNKQDSFTVNVLQADTTAPVVTISSPTNDGYYNATTLPSEPAYSIVEANKYTTKVDGWSTDEGTHTVTVTATDDSNNVGSASATYTVDKTPPSISTALIDGGIYNSTTLKNILEADGGKYYIVQDANLDTSQVSASDLVYTEGDNTATITATDKAGNTATKTIKYTVDNTAPSISFNFNNDGFYQSTFAGFNPYYKVEDLHLDTNSVTASAISLTEGNHNVSVSASDLAGNSNSASASYNVDDTAPTVTIKLDPTKFYNKAALDALGDYYTAEDANLLDVNASDLEEDTDGTYTATVSAKDKAGNSTTKSVDYTVDNTKPVITFNDKLVNGGYYQSGALTDIANSFFTATDAHLDSNSISVSENNESIQKLDLTEGTHTIIVTAVDAAGNETTESITYTIDNTPPEVGFNIIDGSILTSAKLAEILNGKDYYTASDNIGVVSVVEDQLQTLEGTYTLNVTARDAAGNETKKSVTYTVDNTPPIITVPADITAEATGNLTAVILGSAAASDNISSAADINITNDAPTSFPLGTTTVTWTATDKAGNQATATQTVKVQDTTAPTFTFVPKDIVTTTTGTSTKVAIGTATATDIFGATVTNDAPDTFPIGTTTVTWSAKDPSGNIATATQKVTIYQFSGILQPVNSVTTDQDLSTAKVSQYKIGSTVPVKFTLTGEEGFSNPLTATLSLKKSSNALPADAELETAVSTSAATTDNLFRYDSTSGQYIFNLSSKGFTSGTYVIRISLNNGQYYDYFISFK